MTVHVIGDDLSGHGWYEELVAAMLAELEAYLARWAAFADFLGEPVF
jgi:hypothetical protein